MRAKLAPAIGNLRHAIDGERRLDAHDVVDGRHDVVAVQEVIPRYRIRRHFLRPPDRQRVAGTAQMRRQQFHALVGRAARPAPAGVVLVVHQRRTQHIEPTELLQGVDVHPRGGRNAVLGHQFGDGAVLALGRGSVVAPDVEEQRVVAVAEPIQLIDDPPDLDIAVFGEPGGHLHQAALKRPLVLGDVIPRRHPVVTFSELTVLRNPALLLGPLKHPLPVRIPAVVELPGVPVGPLLHDVVRAVQTAAGPVHEERLIGLQRLMGAQPVDRVVGQILRQVIALLGGLRRRHDRGVAHQMGLVLGGLPREKPVEILEPQPGRPVFERAGRRGLLGRGVMPLAPRAGAVPVVLEHLGHQRAAARNLPGIAVPVVGQLGDLTVADLVMIAPGQQRRPRRRTHRGGMEPVVADPLGADPVHRPGGYLAAEGCRQTRAGVVDQHDHDVRRILVQPRRYDARFVRRLLQRPPGNARRWRRRKRQRRTARKLRGHHPAR